MSETPTNGTSTEARERASVVVYQPRPEDVGDLLWDPGAFAHGQRVAAMFAASHLLPEHLRGHVADVTIGLAIARRIGEDPLTLLQSLYVVKGRPGWSAAYLIARAKRAGIHVRWKVERRSPALQIEGKRVMPDLTVTAYALLPGDAEPVEYAVDSRQAIDAGWAKNEQYSHSAELMLRYRSATHLLRLFAPEILLGLPTADEVQAIETVAVDVTPAAAQVGRGMAGLAAALGNDVIDSPPPSPQVASSSAPTEQTAAPAREGGPAPRGGPSKQEREQADDDSRKLGERLKTKPAGARVPLDQARTLLREAQGGLRRVSDERYTRCLDTGAAAGLWTRDGDAIVLPGPEEPPPANEQGDRWTALSDAELLEAVEGTAIRVGDQGSERAKVAAGMGEWTEDEVVNNASDEQLRLLGRALDREEAALRADAERAQGGA